MLSRSNWRYFAIGAVLLLAGCGQAPHQPNSPAAPDEWGAWHVGVDRFAAVDYKRDGRRLAVMVWYPVDGDDAAQASPARYQLAGPISMPAAIALDAPPVSDAGPRRLLIFSHGYGAPNFQSTALMEHLASHGYIVIAPGHAGNTLGANDDDFTTAGSRRVPDVSFLIDTMFARNALRDDPFFRRIDTRGVGVLGHSYGGMTALGSVAGWGETRPDPRVRAAMPISAVVVGDKQRDKRPPPYAGFTRQQVESVSVPVLLLGGTEDRSVLIENNAIAYDWIETDVIRVDIRGANHNHFASVCDLGDTLRGLGLVQPLWPLVGAAQLKQPYASTCVDAAIDIDTVQRLQNLYATAFFHRYLAGMADADAYLTPAYAAENETAVSIYRK